MKFTSGPVYDTIRKDYVNVVTPKLTAEWNMNHYYKTFEDNTPAEDDEGYDLEYFPISSITMPHRPTSGIAKAMTDQALVDQKSADITPAIRYYTVSRDAQYKYWQSPVKSGATAPYNFANHTDSITKVRPRVEYRNENNTARTVVANKIYVCVENSWAVPDDWDIDIKTTTGGSWTTIATNPPIAADGSVQLWWNGTSWTTSRNHNFDTTIHAIRLKVRSMNKANSYFNLIEIGARLELTLTNDLITVSDEATMGEVDHITPLGKVSSNTANITLWNGDGKYDNNNPDSMLYGLIDKNIRFNLSYVYDDVNEVQQFEMYTDDWNASEEEISVSLTDFSKILQERKPSPMVFERIPIHEAVWRICDSVGFTKYIVRSTPTEPHDIINIFWTTGDQSAWEAFQELATATQSAIYFDSDGVLNIVTREMAFQQGKAVDWTVRKDPSGLELPDIINLVDNTTYEANKVKINYQPTIFSQPVRELYPYDIVWQPEGTITLRSTELLRDLTTSANEYILIGPKNTAIWPYSGYVQIEGEWIKYEGKGYTHYNSSNVKLISFPKSEAERAKLYSTTPAALRWRTGWVGSLKVIGRGLFNTKVSPHYVKPQGWARTLRKNFSKNTANAGGFSHNTIESSASLTGLGSWSAKDYLYVHKGNGLDVGYKKLGVRMRIDKTAHKTKLAGIFFNSASIGRGYFIEITPTAKLNATMRKQRNEIIFYSQKMDGSKKLFGGEKIKVKEGNKTVTKNIGAEHAILMGKYFDLDVIFFPYTTGDHGVEVYIDGKMVLSAVIDASVDGSWIQPFVSGSGMYTRGHTKASYEYFYGLNRAIPEHTDEETFYDRIEGGYRGLQGEKDVMYDVRQVRRKNAQGQTVLVNQRYNAWIFEEFGPIVHEARQFDVEFNTDGRPTIESKLYHTNDTDAVAVDYMHNVNSAQFMVVNTSRRNAVINGEDTLNVAGSGSAINQKLFIYGRPAKQQEVKSITKENEAAIRRRGIIETEYQSKWIQTEGSAQALGKWLVDTWAENLSEITVEIFGNPLIELTDMVAVQYENMTPEEHKYFVTRIATSFDAGITTTLTLRRALQ